MTQGNSVIEQHKHDGGACYEIIDGHLTETEGSKQLPLLGVDELPGAFGGKATHVLANALAAVAACRAAGISAKDIRRALVTFSPDEANPGRANIYRAGGSTVIVDYGHNAAALQATGKFVNAVWGNDLVAAVTLPGDRRDDLLVHTAEAIACWFGKVVIYEDADKRGRKPGEMTELISTALHSKRPDVQCEEAENPADALRLALQRATGAPVLFLYEKLAMARDALQAVGAEPWSDSEGAETLPAVTATTVLPKPELSSPMLPSPVLPSPVQASPVPVQLLPANDGTADNGITCGCEPTAPEGSALTPQTACITERGFTRSTVGYSQDWSGVGGNPDGHG